MSISPTQVAAWFREQAAKYLSMAETVERDFNLGKSQIGPRPTTGSYQPLIMPHVPTVEEVKETIGTRKMRKGAIAEELKINNPALLDSILTEENGFDLGERGWISVKTTVIQ